MRAFRSGFTGAVYGGALCHAVRRVLDSSDDEMLSVTIRGILRRHGPLPLPRVSALLSDEAVEVLGRVPGGLSRYMQDRAWRFRVEALPNGMRVALLSADIQRAGDGARIVSQALAHAAVAPQQRISVAQLFRDLPAATQRQCGSAAHLEAFLLRHPGAVRVSAGIVCGPPAHSSSPRAAAQTANKNSALSASAAVPAGRGFEAAPGNFSPPPPPTPTTAGAAEDPRTLKLLALLHAAVPCSCYVPLRAVLRHPRRRICIEVDAPLSDILDALQRIPSSVLDCRVMGDTEDDVFLRMLDAERRAFLANEGVNADSYDVLAFGNPLHDAFMAFAARGPDEAQRVRGGIAMSELSEILPEDLLQRMRALYGAARGDPACIFIFDRLRHLFDVNLSQYRARPWAALSAREQPSSLTWLTTPTPVVLRNALAALEARPLSPAALHAALAVRSQRQMAAAYGGAAAFVARHSLFLVAQDGLVLTPLHAARTHGARLGPGPGNGGPGGPGGPGGGGGGPGGGPGGFGGGAGGGAAGPLSEGQRARMLCDALPQGHAVEWQRFRIHPALRELPFDARRLRPDFFERHRNLFTSYEVLGTTTFIVGRRDGTPPDPHLLHAPCHTLADLVRLIALFSIDGAQEGTITNYLSKDARLVMRRYGTIEHIARQLPMWFDVRNDRQEAGCAFISYIGTSAQPTDVNTERDK